MKKGEGVLAGGGETKRGERRGRVRRVLLLDMNELEVS
jgi:hypothetical protein